MLEKIEGHTESSEKPHFFIAEQEIIMVGHSNKCPARKPEKTITVVLDMDSTSLDAILPKDWEHMDASTFQSRKNVASLTKVYLRPGVQEFLLGLSESVEIEVIIWTAAVDAFIQKYLHELHYRENKPLCDYVIYRDSDEWKKDEWESFAGQNYRKEAYKNLTQLLGKDSNRTEGTIFIIDDNHICLERYNKNRSIHAPKFSYAQKEGLFFFELLQVFADAEAAFFRLEEQDPKEFVKIILEFYHSRDVRTHHIAEDALSREERSLPRAHFFNPISSTVAAAAGSSVHDEASQQKTSMRRRNN